MKHHVKKYHVNDSGEVLKCDAGVKPCRYSDREEQRHFESRAEAERAGEALLEKKYGGSYTLSAEVEIEPTVEKILRDASRGTYPKKITEHYATEKIFAGDSAKLNFLKDISTRKISEQTKIAIGKMSIRSDIELSYNNLDISDSIASNVDLIDEDFHEGSIEDYVAAGAKNLPWNRK